MIDRSGFDQFFEVLQDHVVNNNVISSYLLPGHVEMHQLLTIQTVDCSLVVFLYLRVFV